MTGSLVNNGVISISNGSIVTHNDSNTVIVNNGNCTISGGSYTSTNSWTVYNSSSGSMTINGGDLLVEGSQGAALYNEGTLEASNAHIESGNTGFANHGGTATLRNMYIKVKSSSGYIACLNRAGGSLTTTNNVILSNSSFAALYNQEGTVYSFDDSVSSIAGVVTRYQYLSTGYAKISLYGYTGLYSHVAMATWTENNGQDDLQWYIAGATTDSSGSYHSYGIYTPNHNYEIGPYITHIYSYNTSTGAKETFLSGIVYTINP